MQFKTQFPRKKRTRDDHSTESPRCAFTQPTGWWKGQLPMTSSLVRRTVKRGDIFLVIEDTVYVANVL